MEHIRSECRQYLKSVPHLLECGQKGFNDGATANIESQSEHSVIVKVEDKNRQVHKVKVEASGSQVDWNCECNEEQCEHVAMAILKIGEESSNNRSRDSNHRPRHIVSQPSQHHENICSISERIEDFPTLSTYLTVTGCNHEEKMKIIRQLFSVFEFVHGTRKCNFKNVSPDYIFVDKNISMILISEHNIQPHDGKTKSKKRYLRQKKDVLLLGGIFHYILSDGNSELDFKKWKNWNISNIALDSPELINWLTLIKKILRKDCNLLHIQDVVNYANEKCFIGSDVQEYANSNSGEECRSARKDADIMIKNKIKVFMSEKLSSGSKLHRAHHCGRNSFVAVKFMLQREVKDPLDICIAPEHENIVTCHCVGRTDYEGQSHIYSVMELCEKSMKEAFPSEKSTQEKIEIMFQIAKGLQCLHNANIIHGNLKPSNILRRDRCYKISDYKLLRDAERPSADLSNRFKVSGEPLSRSSDVFSFGAIFCCMLAGTTNFGANASKLSENLLSLVKAEKPLIKLFTEQLVHLQPNMRPNMDVVVKHPIFWNVEKIWQFFIDVIEYFNGLPKSETEKDCWAEFDNFDENDSIRSEEVFPREKDWSKSFILSPKQADIFGAKETDALIKHVGVIKRTTSVIRLIKFIRNRVVHRREDIKEGLYSENLTKQELWGIVSDKFPLLLLYTFCKIGNMDRNKNWQLKKILGKYFPEE